MSEHKLQAEIRNRLAGECLLFRANVGRGWTGDAQRLPDGSILIRNPRPFDTGLPPGFSDLFGINSTTITPGMVGQTVGQFCALEVKTSAGRLSDKQGKFLAAVERAGGVSGVVRSAADALKLLRIK